MKNPASINLLILFLLEIMFFCIYGCSPKQQPYMLLSLTDVLKKNEQLSVVLEKYKNDSLKLNAAKFLIENLPYHYSYEGVIVDNYVKLYELHSTGKYYPEKVLDSIVSIYGRFDYNKATVKKDLYIDPNYLTDNIDWAFKVWQEQPWGKNVSFENFCEYILPYRVGDERLMPWREKIYNQFNPILDSVRMLPEAEDPLYVSRIMLKHLKSLRPFYFSYIFDGPNVGSDIVNWYSGYCRESSDILIYVFRALGIPCGRDYIFVRGDDNEAHEWNFVLDKNGASHYCSITYASNEPEATDTYWWSKGKVNRQTFSVNKEMMGKMKANFMNIHPYFKNPKFADVTLLYTGERNHAVIIPQEKLYYKPQKGEVIYLCSSSRQEWLPLAISSYKSRRDSIRFNNVEGGVVFRLAIYKHATLKPLTAPFLLDKETGAIRYFEGGDEMEKVVLLHKFHLDYNFPWNMVGGVFEASNRADFAVKDTLFVIRDRPQRKWYVVKLNIDKKYYYLRYVGPAGSHCDVAEIAFYRNYSDTIPIKGEIIGTPNIGELKKTNDYTNVFDGDTKTSFTYYLPDGGWIGLKLKKAEKIGKIVFTARNRDNFIERGNLYELFYDKNGSWVSAGKIQATSDSLAYDVPKGSLLYLKNHTQGKDERIFEINERFYHIEQIFW